MAPEDRCSGIQEERRREETVRTGATLSIVPESLPGTPGGVPAAVLTRPHPGPFVSTEDTTPLPPG